MTEINSIGWKEHEQRKFTADSVVRVTDTNSTEEIDLLKAQVTLLNQLLSRLGVNPDASGRLRVNVETGGTIGAVATVSNITSIGTYYAYTLIMSQNNLAVMQGVRNHINIG